MKCMIGNRTLLLAVAAFSFTAAIAGQEATSPEREQPLRYLAESRAGLLEAVRGLSDEQLSFKPASDRWCVAEVLEHLALTEDLVLTVLDKIGDGPAPPADRNAKQIDAMIQSRVPDRSTKVQAPPPLIPAGRWTPAQSLDRFVASRRKLESFVRSSSVIRGHIADHPALGALEGYQWALAAAAHTVRHTSQILEVKADSRFPSSAVSRNDSKTGQ